MVSSDAAAWQLRHRHDLDQKASGFNAWAPADVLTWDQWLRSLWSEAITQGLESRLLLNSTQEHALWREIIQQEGNGTAEGLASVDALAKLAAAAWKLSEAYGATNRLRQFAVTHDARTFAGWAEAFSSLCRAQGFVSRANLEAAIRLGIGRSAIHIERPLALASFARWTPTQATLIQELRKAGADVLETEIIAEGLASPKRFLLRTESEPLELHHVARWTRHFVERRVEAGLSATVGVLVPGLDGLHIEVGNAFRQVLAPEIQNVAVEDEGSPFEIIHSNALKTEPMVAAALALITWAAKPLSRDAVSALLLSPYLVPDSAMEKAVYFDAYVLRLAKLLRPEISLKWLVKEVAHSGAAPALAWPSSLARFLERSERLDAPRGFAHWTEFIRQLLRSAGWPGTKPQSAHEVDVTRAWEHALDSVATLDFNGANATFADTLQALSHELVRASSTAAGCAPIQVLDPSGARGMTFDALIFARSTDESWPALPGPNALIAWPLQLQLGMPGAERSTAMAEARIATSRLLSAAATVVFSFSAANAEGPQRLSPLIAALHLPLKSPADLELESEPIIQVDAEVTEDSSPLPALPSRSVRGGATVLQHQAACGFRAFAEIRLRAHELESRDVGHDARDQGNLLHTVMQRFWKHVRTQGALKAMSSDARTNLLNQFADECLGTAASSDTGWDAAYLSVQKQRLVHLLTLWLDLEVRRSNFEVISTEEAKALALGPLDLQLRVDRIDRVEEGDFLVDYKTGSSASAADWDGDRPDEPQLPLYTLLARENNLAGLAFARVRRGKDMSWQGYTGTAGVLPAKDTARDLEALQAEWHGALVNLAEAFAEGDISVSPKSYPSTCAYCAHNLLCRLDAATLLGTEDQTEISEEEEMRG